MASVAEYPSIIKNALLTKTKNSASIYAISFNIRGKPWVVVVDDYLFMRYRGSDKYSLVFAKPDE